MKKLKEDKNPHCNSASKLFFYWRKLRTLCELSCIICTKFKEKYHDEMAVSYMRILIILTMIHADNIGLAKAALNCSVWEKREWDLVSKLVAAPTKAWISHVLPQLSWASIELILEDKQKKKFKKAVEKHDQDLHKFHPQIILLIRSHFHFSLCLSCIEDTLVCVCVSH